MSFRSDRKSRSAGPSPACIAPKNLPAADLHAGLDAPRDDLHHEMLNATSCVSTPNSPTVEAQKRSASAVTFGFLCVAVCLWSCATTNLGPSASVTDISAAVAGPRSFTSATFCAAPETTRAPSGFEKPAALSASAPRISNTLPST